MTKLQKKPRTLPAVAGLELAPDQALDEEAVAEEGADCWIMRVATFGPRTREAAGLSRAPPGDGPGASPP